MSKLLQKIKLHPRKPETGNRKPQMMWHPDLRFSNSGFRLSKWVMISLILFMATGCRQDMYNQPKYNPLQKNTFFDDERASRPLEEGTVARGHLNTDAHFYTGKVNGQLVNSFPFPITEKVLSRGRERYNIFCSPCHDRSGHGKGMIVQRGFRQPPSFHIARLQQAPVGHFFNVITNGFGVMYDYADRVPPADRWAIVAYIRALQLSQNATIQDVPQENRQALLRKQ